MLRSIPSMREPPMAESLPAATFADTQPTTQIGYTPSHIGALIGWEWLQREVDIFATFSVAHYRPKERPDTVRVIHHKTKEENFVPLFKDGAPLYPELMAELDAIKRERIRGPMLCRDWSDRSPWPTWPKPDQPDLTHLSRKVKDVIRAAGLRDELSFTSFRHGGFTESGDAGLSESRDHGAGAAPNRQGAAALREAHHRSGRDWRAKAACVSNENRSEFRMSGSSEFRIENR
jgi:hypothetical protein